VCLREGSRDESSTPRRRVSFRVRSERPEHQETSLSFSTRTTSRANGSDGVCLAERRSGRLPHSERRRRRVNWVRRPRDSAAARVRPVRQPAAAVAAPRLGARARVPPLLDRRRAQGT
jgi:hypothetical protein